MRGGKHREIPVLLAVLAWLILLNEAVGVNIENKKALEMAALEEEKAAEKTAAEADAPENGAVISTVPAASQTADPTLTASPAEESAVVASPAGESAVAASPVAAAGETQAGDTEPQIRVLIMDSGYSSYFHPEVTVLQDGQERTYTAQEIGSEGGIVVLEGGAEGITVTSVSRQEGNPAYPGTLEIRAEEEGLLLINELPLETYLEAVVPSEMPSSYHSEALKAQAICARTYACKQMEDGKLKESYPADVDDSVSCQVYRNIAPKEETSRAVQDTAGQVLTQGGELIEAYYFSTSAGVTSTDEIWGAGEAAPYLKSVDCSFDSGEPWRKWNVTIPWETLKLRSGELDGCCGALLSVNAAKKNESGAVTELEVVTEAGTTRISGEYKIRQFLSPQGLTVTENSGETTVGGALLPSAYFTLETNPGDCVCIDGGGYGHGVGMSQTAANVMAKEGYTCQEILDYFFKDVVIGNLKGII